MAKKKNNIVHIKLYKAAVKYKAEVSGGSPKNSGQVRHLRASTIVSATPCVRGTISFTAHTLNALDENNTARGL